MDPRSDMVRAENNHDRRRPRPHTRRHSTGVVGERWRGKPGRVAIWFFWLIPKWCSFAHVMGDGLEPEAIQGFQTAGFRNHPQCVGTNPSFGSRVHASVLPRYRATRCWWWQSHCVRPYEVELKCNEEGRKPVMKWTVACLFLQAICRNDALQSPPSDLEKMLIPLPLQVYLGNHSIGEVIETLEDGDVAKDETTVETVKDEVQPKQKTENGKSKAIAPPENPSIEVDSPLLKSASEEVKAQVEHGVKKAVKEGLAEMEEAAKEAQQKWVSEATVVALEDQARLKKAVALDLDQVTSKVKAVQGVQQKVLHNMERQVQAAVQNITRDVLISSAGVARNRSWELANKALGPSLAAISDGEATIETLRNEALEQEEEAASDASRLATAAQKAQNYLRGLTQLPQAAAEELHKRVDLDLEEAKAAKGEAKSALDAMKEAKEDADKTLSLANLTEAEAEEVLKNALAQAEEIKELETLAKEKAEGQSMLQFH
eukprot:s1559_g25.t1